jgi:PilZ domain-containing protein
MSVSWAGCAENEYEITSVNPGSEARASERVPICCKTKLSYQNEDGCNTTINGRVLNMSTSGVLVEARGPVAVGSKVRIQSNELLVGTAFVRHSTRSLWKFTLGLEFATAIRERY